MNAEKTIQIVGVQTAEGEDAGSDDLRGKFHPFFLSLKNVAICNICSDS